MKVAFIGLAVVLGCGTDSSGTDWVANFHPPAVPSGYTRFVAATVPDIEPGANVEYCQWVAGPSTADRDVLDLKGYQSATGHHAVLYATTETSYAVGESHICTVQDMLSISFLGAIGGEGLGGSAAALPDGLYYRLPAGQALMVNSHWLNAMDQTVDGQAVFDVKFAPASPDRMIADLFANNGDNFQLAPGPGTYDVNCVLQQDLNFAMVTNHMHTLGISAYTELIHGDGSKQMLIADSTWLSDEQFNPIYQRYSVSTPLVAHAGDTYHTHCEWNNTTADTVLFPTEMCDGIGFYFPAQVGQLVCDNGGWPGM